MGLLRRPLAAAAPRDHQAEGTGQQANTTIQDWLPLIDSLESGVDCRCGYEHLVSSGKTPKNLVVCIDGTAQKVGQKVRCVVSTTRFQTTNTHSELECRRALPASREERSEPAYVLR